MSLVALDIGTSRMKALLAHWDGHIEQVCTVKTPARVPAAGQLEFQADAIHAQAATLVAEVAATHPDDPVDTLVFSCLGTAMVPLDRGGRPLGPALSPADVRPLMTPALIDGIDLTADDLVRITGQDPRIPSFLLHWLWWRQAYPDSMRSLRRFRSLRGFLVHELTGADAEDPSWASRTMLMDLVTSKWSQSVLAAAGLPIDVLPEIHPSTSAWPVLRAAGSRFGLSPDARVVLGGIDNCSAVLGATDPSEERLVNIAGTYEHMAGVGPLDVARCSAAAVDGLVHTYHLPGRYLSYSRVLLGNLLLQAAEGSPDTLGRLLDGVSDDPEGQTIGLEEGAVRSELRAGTPPVVVIQRLLESSGAILVRYADAWVAAGQQVDRIVAVGGGAANPHPLQLKANLLGRSLSTLTFDESAGLGALRLAAMAVRGASPSVASHLFPNPILHTWSPRAAKA
jgi:sugar (pentulose or hexulose) kinase